MMPEITVNIGHNYLSTCSKDHSKGSQSVDNRRAKDSKLRGTKSDVDTYHRGKKNYFCTQLWQMSHFEFRAILSAIFSRSKVVTNRQFLPALDGLPGAANASFLSAKNSAEYSTKCH